MTLSDEHRRLANHLHEWDKRHRLSGRRRALVWLRETGWGGAIFVVVACAILVLGILLTLPTNEVRLPQPSDYDPGLYTPFTRAPRPPHPASIYTPPGR